MIQLPKSNGWSFETIGRGNTDACRHVRMVFLFSSALHTSHDYWTALPSNKRKATDCSFKGFSQRLNLLIQLVKLNLKKKNRLLCIPHMQQHLQQEKYLWLLLDKCLRHYKRVFCAGWRSDWGHFVMFYLESEPQCATNCATRLSQSQIQKKKKSSFIDATTKRVRQNNRSKPEQKQITGN